MARLVCWLLLGLLSTSAPAHADAAIDIEVFSRAGCPHCAAADEFLVELRREQPALRVVTHDVRTDIAARARLQALATRYGMAPAGVPAFLIGDRLLIGFDGAATTGVALRELLATGAASEALHVRLFGAVLDPDRMGLALFSLALGVLDGFNPCSMWVLVFMLAMLAPLRNRRRMLLVAGTFVAIEGIAYFAFMAAWLNTFRAVGVSRVATLVVGLAGCVMGLIHLKDFFALGRGISLSIPAAARPGIYAGIRRIVAAEHTLAAVLATAVLALLVQAVEFLCTAGIPALFTRILTLHELEPWRHYGYMLLYILMYMLDDVVVLTVGVVTLSQRRLQKAEGRWLKLLSGVVLLSLGIYLLQRTA